MSKSLSFKKLILILISLLSLISLVCFLKYNKAKKIIYESKSLVIEKISSRAYRHISYLDFDDNHVACNGLIFINKKQVLIFDTPCDDSSSQELIDFMI
jgi:metallo-beta-lactamase class B